MNHYRAWTELNISDFYIRFAYSNLLRLAIDDYSSLKKANSTHPAISELFIEKVPKEKRYSLSSCSIREDKPAADAHQLFITEWAHRDVVHYFQHNHITEDYVRFLRRRYMSGVLTDTIIRTIAVFLW